jgi:hypothetical protein
MERAEVAYERQQALHEREMQMLNEKYQKLESMLQIALKEKNTVSASTVAKDKEIDDLRHKQDVLRSKASCKVVINV